MKKIILTTAVTLASLPTYSMLAIDDAELSNIEGRAGITIESQLHDTTTIGEVSYTDSDGDGLRHTDSAGIYLSDISIGASSSKSTIDVLNDGTLNINISDIMQGDVWVRDIAMGDANTSFGAVGITNFNYDAAGSYNLRFSPFSPKNDGIKQAALIFDIDMASSSFDFTYVDEAEFSLLGERELFNGNTISYTTQFTDFKALATTVYADDSITDDGRQWIRMDLGSITGSTRLENISFGSVTDGIAATSQVLGSAGFSGIDIDDSSFIALSGHAGSGLVGVDLKVAAKANLDNFYFETNGNRVNFANIAIDTDARGVNGDSNIPFNISMDTVNNGFRKGLQFAISDVSGLSATVRDMSVSQGAGARDIFGSIGIENINFNGGTAEMYVIGRAGSGNTGIETGFSLPDGTTLDFTINDFEYESDLPDAERVADKGGEVRATIEINDFFVGQTIDVVKLEDSEGAALKMTFTGMEGSFDVTNFSAGTRAGSFGRIVVDGMQLRRGYLIVDAIGQ